jgi:uncharacterized membrane protein YeiH
MFLTRYHWNSRFALSGALTAMSKKSFGVFIIAFVTAVGGGTLRDVMIGTTPVGWMLDLEYVYVICIAFALALYLEKNSETAYVTVSI